MVTPGRISLVTMKELSAVLAECTARTEIARAGVEEARKKQEAATAKQEELTAMLQERWAEADARWEKEQVAMREAREERALETKAILAELKEHRDERRALIEAIFRVIDRLDRQQPPPPPDLRSV
jgi:(p)ppGpp synthase/HD superfamily hydrolase